MSVKVKIIRSLSGEVVRTLSYANNRMAERAERGVLKRINTDEYHTEIEEKKG